MSQISEIPIKFDGPESRKLQKLPEPFVGEKPDMHVIPIVIRSAMVD
jgi:hypothetical protein